MRKLVLGQEVVRELGADTVGVLRDGPWPASYTCTSCGIRSRVDDGPVSVRVDRYEDHPIVHFAHARCAPSAVIDLAGPAPCEDEHDSVARVGVAMHPSGPWPYVIAEVMSTYMAAPACADGRPVDGADMVTLELAAYCERGLVPTSTIGPNLPALPQEYAACPLVLLTGGPGGAGGVFLPKTTGDDRRMTVIHPMPPLMKVWVQAVHDQGRQCGLYVASRVGLFDADEQRYPHLLEWAFDAGRVVGGIARVAQGAHV